MLDSIVGPLSFFLHGHLSTAWQTNMRSNFRPRTGRLVPRAANTSCNIFFSSACLVSRVFWNTAGSVDPNNNWDTKILTGFARSIMLDCSANLSLLLHHGNNTRNWFISLIILSYAVMFFPRDPWYGLTEQPLRMTIRKWKGNFVYVFPRFFQWHRQPKTIHIRSQFQWRCRSGTNL